MNAGDNVDPPAAEGIRDLVHEWAWLLDHGRWHDAASLLTDDAVVTGLGPDRYGPGGFRDWADARAANPGRKTRHQVTNLRIGSGADDVVTATCTLVLYVADADSSTPRVEFVGEYRDEVVPTPGGWRFRRRDIVRLGDD